MSRAEQSEVQTGDKIVTEMREDARAEAAAIESEQDEEDAEDGELDHDARGGVRQPQTRELAAEFNNF